MSSKKAVITFLVFLVLLGFVGLRAASHPEYLNQYLNDPRSKPELHTNCAICHSPDKKATEKDFLSDFGRDFKANRYRITERMRQRYTYLFNPIDQPVEGLSPETVSISTTEVIVNVTVTNARGKYVSTLDREAFQLLEDDREQELVDFLGEETPMAVAVLLDISGSAIERDLDRYRNAILDLANRLRPSDTVAIYTFDTSGVSKIRDYSSNVHGLKPLLKSLKGEGQTPLYDAILLASSELRDRPEPRRAIILLSDGADSAGSSTLREVEKQTFLAGTSVYAIDLVNTEKSSRRSAERQAAAQTLKQIAQESGGRYITTEGGFFLIPGRMKLQGIFKDLIDELHSQYTLIYEPANLRKLGRWRTIRINLEQADLSARTRLGYREGLQ